MMQQRTSETYIKEVISLSKQDPRKLSTRIEKLTSISGKGILILDSIISQLYALRKST